MAPAPRSSSAPSLPAALKIHTLLAPHAEAIRPVSAEIAGIKESDKDLPNATASSHQLRVSATTRNRYYDTLINHYIETSEELLRIALRHATAHDADAKHMTATEYTHATPEGLLVSANLWQTIPEDIIDSLAFIHAFDHDLTKAPRQRNADGTLDQTTQKHLDNLNENFSILQQWLDKVGSQIHQAINATPEHAKQLVEAIGVPHPATPDEEPPVQSPTSVALWQLASRYLQEASAVATQWQAEITSRHTPPPARQAG